MPYDKAGMKIPYSAVGNTNRKQYSVRAIEMIDQHPGSSNHSLHTLDNTVLHKQQQNKKTNLNLGRRNYLANCRIGTQINSKSKLTLHFHPYFGIDVTIGLWHMAW